MAKRFTDSEKWEDPWFRNLLPEYQRFWIYLLDKCDASGVWKVDFEMADFCLKQPVKEKEMLAVFKDRIRVFDHGEKWFIPRFISFQYGTLDERCNPHKSVFKLLRSYKMEGYLEGINTPKNKDKIKIKDKIRTKEEKGGGGGKGIPPSIAVVKDFFKNNLMADTFYDHYQTNGWVQGKNKPIKDWVAAARNWQRRQGEFSKNGSVKTNLKKTDDWKCFVCEKLVPELQRRAHMDFHEKQVQQQ